MAIEKKLSASAIVSALAAAVCQRVTCKVIRGLQRMDASMCGGTMLSGEGTGLENVWDEICVQMQSEESCAWEAYDATINALVAGCVEDLSGFEREALWLQTRQGEDWEFENDDERSSYPVCNDDIETYLRQSVLNAANDWSNSRIRAFIDRPLGGNEC